MRETQNVYSSCKARAVNEAFLDCRQVGETESTVQDVLIQEVMAVEPVAFKAIIVDIDSIQVQRTLTMLRSPKRFQCQMGSFKPFIFNIIFYFRIHPAAHFEQEFALESHY